MEHQPKISITTVFLFWWNRVIIHIPRLTIFRVMGFVLILGLIIAPRVHALSLAPDFTLSDVNGETFSLSDFHGSIVLLEFMATWCGPCQSQVPHLQTVQTEFGSQITILSIGVSDTDDALRQFRDDHNSDWIYAPDTLNLPATYGVTGIPTLYIIDQNGYIRSQYHMTTVDAAILIEEIRSLSSYTLTLTTSPTFDNVHFQIDGRDYRTVNGSIKVELEAELHQITLSDTLIKIHGVEYQFTNWSGFSGDSNPSIQINVTADTVLAANFVAQNNTSTSHPEKPLQYFFPMHGSDPVTQLVVHSCCQVSAFQYTEAEHIITFQVDDALEETGFVNVTIPLDILGDDYTIQIDGLQVNSFETRNNTHAFIYITYPHSNHLIEILLADDVKSDPNNSAYEGTEIPHIFLGLSGVLAIIGVRYRRLLAGRIQSFTNFKPSNITKHPPKNNSKNEFTKSEYEFQK